MTGLKLYLLGPPQVELDGAPVDLQRRKALALLIYLAVSGQAHSRESLATFLWPELDSRRGRAYLRRELAVLNTSLHGAWLSADREMVELNREAGLWLDIEQFQRLLAACQKHGHAPEVACSECVQLLAEAVALYSGDFLAGFTLRDSSEFDDWQFFQTESLRQALAMVLERLVRGLKAQEKPEAAISHARRWVMLDPLHEPAQYQLIQVYDQAGQPTAALRQYEEYVKLLEEGFGLPPEEETTTLYEAIKAKRMLGSFLKAEQQRDKQKESSPAQSQVAPPPEAAPHHNLPAPPTSFIGREKELTEIRRLLVEEPACRLLTLVGPGGIGKTRLALAAASQTLDHFAHGVYFVPVAPLDSVDEIISSQAEALDFRFYEGETPKRQLLDYLQDRQMLLYLDNFEHLLAGAQLVADILQDAPGVKILVTSRERLNLSGETVFTVGSLEIPLANSLLKDTLEFDAAKLFLQQARLARPGFEPQAEDRAGIEHICRLTQGMPLALVLAAGWLNVLSVQEIAAELSQSLDILETEMSDVPERQRSVRAVFDSSWRQMSQGEQQAFMKLSIFRGGFTRQAAQTVAGAGLPTLRALINKSLVVLSQNERYEIHELLRQYGEMELEAWGQADTTRQKHSAYYLDLLHQCEANLIGPKQRETLNQIEADLDNIRPAWNWAVENEQVEAIAHSLESLYQFYWIRSYFQEGERVFGTTLSHWQTLVQKSEHDLEPGLLKLMSRQGAFCYALGLVEKAAERLQTGLELARRLNHKKELAFVFNYLGELTRTQGKFSIAIQLFEESLSFSREIDEPLYIAQALKGLGWVSGEEGGTSLTSQRYYEEALAYYRAASNQAEIAFCLDKLGLNAWGLGDYLESQKLFQESLEIFRSIGDQLGTAKALGGLALVTRSLGDDRLAEAEVYARESLETCRATGHKLEIVNRLGILGIVLFKMDKLDQAEQYLQEAIDLSGRIQYDIGVTGASNCLGQVAIKRQAFQKARSLLLDALHRASNNQRSQDIAEVLTNYALLLVREAPPNDDETRNERSMEAVELLTLAINHSSAWQDTIDNGGRLLAELEAALPPESFSAARTRAESLTLEQAAKNVLQAESKFLAG